MCNCSNKPGFRQALSEAKGKTKKTGEQHVIFHKPVVDLFFVVKESDLNDSLEICCYFLPDGTEKQYVAGSQVAKMDVVTEENVEGAAPASDDQPKLSKKYLEKQKKSAKKADDQAFEAALPVEKRDLETDDDAPLKEEE